MSRDEPLVVVANRLPITWTEGQGWTPSAGGLVTALEDAFSGDRGHWVGWSGGIVSKAQTITVTMNANISVTANFK